MGALLLPTTPLLTIISISWSPLFTRMLGWRRAHLFSATSLSVSRACEVFVFTNEKTSV
eukprot:COSAG06_NODE_1349_length_9776_cov_110.373049_2_plen_59_part_00